MTTTVLHTLGAQLLHCLAVLIFLVYFAQTCTSIMEDNRVSFFIIL